MDIIKKLNFDFKTNQLIIKVISQIDLFKGKWDINEKKENRYLKELRKIATIESIGSSTRIEGSKLTDEEIKKLLDNIKITKFVSRDEQEVIGYFDTLEIIYDNYATIDLTENSIKHLHNILLKHSDKDSRHRGKYKTLSNKVVANYPNGTQKVIFNTTEPHLVDSQMRDLVKWAKTQFTKQDIHPLLIIATFIYEFVSIHPFQDGNGRLSRLLTTLLLIKYNYQFVQYVSFENLIEQKKKDYYQALMSGQKNRDTKNEIIDKWILFFLECINILISRLEKKYDIYKQKGGYLNDRQKNLIEFIKKNQPIKLNDLSKKFGEISINTIKKDLLHLKNENIIESIGRNKGTIYILHQDKQQMP
ncbi:MAG: Fic family protein [Bacteroidia bacterium]|nr:Fic family protein [Bacteroidia bacterium]